MGNVKYLITGESVNVIETVKNGFIVQYVFTDGHEEFISGDSFFTKEVFDSAPTHKLDAKIESLEKQISELAHRKNTLQAELSEFEKSTTARMQLLRQYKGLQRLEDYIGGKITHVAFLSTYDPKYLSINACISEYTPNGIKLLSLFGDSKGDLTWGINQYKDGSGRYTTCVPCTSEDEAIQAIKDFIHKTITTPTPHNPTYTDSRMIDAANKYHVPIPEEYMRNHKANKTKSLNDSIARSEKELNDLKNRLAELENLNS